MKIQIFLTLTILVNSTANTMQSPEEERRKQSGTLVSATEAVKSNYVLTAKELITTCKEMHQNSNNCWNFLPADIDSLVHNYVLFEQYKSDLEELLSKTISEDLPFLPQLLSMNVGINLPRPFHIPPEQYRGHWTALTEAAGTGRIKQVQAFLAVPGINVNIEGSFVPTIDPFEKDEFAEQNSRVTTMEAGIIISLWPITRQRVSPAEAEVKHTPLHHATARNYLEIMRLLLEAGAETEAVDAQERTPLYYAACKGNLKATKLLFAHNARYALRSRGLSPLHAAAAVNAVDVVTYLLNERIANPNFTDVYLRTALLFAAEKGALESVKALITAGADVNKARKDGLTPLQIACIMGHDKIAATLLKQENINLTSIGNKLALHYSVENGQALVVSLLLQDSRFDPNLLREDGKTPLMRAVEKAHTQTVAVLLSDKRVDTTLKYNGKTAYQLAQNSPKSVARDKVLALFKDHKKTDEEYIIQ